MFGRLLTPLVTPLVSRLDTAPRPKSTFESNDEADDASEENFARDVMIEVMRNSVDSLHGAETLKEKMEALGEIHRVMLEEPCTKDIFRELNGFLLVISVLSVLYPLVQGQDDETPRPEDPQRLVFMVLAESVNGHPGNARFFEEHIGYNPLLDSLRPFLTDSNIDDQAFEFLPVTDIDVVPDWRYEAYGRIYRTTKNCLQGVFKINEHRVIFSGNMQPSLPKFSRNVTIHYNNTEQLTGTSEFEGFVGPSNTRVELSSYGTPVGTIIGNVDAAGPPIRHAFTGSGSWTWS